MPLSSGMLASSHFLHRLPPPAKKPPFPVTIPPRLRI